MQASPTDVLELVSEEGWLCCAQGEQRRKLDGKQKKYTPEISLSRSYGIPQPLRVTLCAGEYNIISKMMLIVSECECRGASIRLV